MINPIFVDDDYIDTVKNDQNDETTVDDGSIDDTIFTTPISVLPSTSGLITLELSRQKISDLYRHLGVTNNPNLADLERFRYSVNDKGVPVLEFFKNNKEWVNLTDKRTGEFLADATLKKRLGGESAMVRVLGLDNTPDRFQRQKQAAISLNRSMPTDLEMEAIPLEDLGQRVSDVGE